MRSGPVLRGLGYVVSIVSVVLLGIPALRAAADDRAMLYCLVAGMTLSIIGMALRWRSHRQERRANRTEAAAAGERLRGKVDA